MKSLRMRLMVNTMSIRIAFFADDMLQGLGSQYLMDDANVPVRFQHSIVDDPNQ
jgi:meiotically up-regulated gene 157 (Mug157) protein